MKNIEVYQSEFLSQKREAFEDDLIEKYRRINETQSHLNNEESHELYWSLQFTGI